MATDFFERQADRAPQHQVAGGDVRAGGDWHRRHDDGRDGDAQWRVRSSGRDGFAPAMTFPMGAAARRGRGGARADRRRQPVQDRPACRRRHGRRRAAGWAARFIPNTTDPVERRLLNVVEEMALASGVPVPPVFLLDDEEGINAFAAGFSPSDAVIGVTRGCAEQLTRDQLQGVIAHEFSHILNGDMRLNLRLIGVLHGILLMGLVGRELLRIAGSRRRRQRSRRTTAALYLLLIGLAFMVLGFLGVFFGNLIKAAVSRQREYLADASAVQFTRNPEGIAGALKRIGAAVFGSKLVSAARGRGEPHVFRRGRRAALFATHPPLDERIRRLDPQWDGKYPPALPADAGRRRSSGEGAAGFVGGDAAAVSAEPCRSKSSSTRPSRSAIRPRRIAQYAAELVAAMPPQVVDAAHEPYGARAVIFASLLDRDADVRAAQLRALEQLAEPDVFELTLQAGAVRSTSSTCGRDCRWSI